MGAGRCAMRISRYRIGSDRISCTTRQFDLAASAADVDRMFTSLEARVPTQTNRSDEQIEWQQFATPPRLAWLAARACALSRAKLVLEPSAGTGMLAVWAAKAGSRLALNEISPLRRDCLSALFPAARVTGHDAELIDELLDPAIIPSVVLMNPPYSHGIERGHDSRTGARHLRSAWNRLASGGRLVAIMPEWFDCAKFLAGLKGPVAAAQCRRRTRVRQAGHRHHHAAAGPRQGGRLQPSLSLPAQTTFASWSILSMPCRIAPAWRPFPSNRAFRLVRRFVWSPHRAGRCRHQPSLTPPADPPSGR
jgi:predicted RNA methylase